MIYVDIFTNQDKGITLAAQKFWLLENDITKVKHIGTKNETENAEGGFAWIDRGQFNRWRFENEEDALAFKLRWL